MGIIDNLFGDNDLIYYTDGRDKLIGGISWVRVDEEKDIELNNFSMKIINEQSSTRLEMLAVPEDGSVKIYTDSQAVIWKWNRLEGSLLNTSERKLLDENDI